LIRNGINSGQPKSSIPHASVARRVPLSVCPRSPPASTRRPAASFTRQNQPPAAPQRGATPIDDKPSRC
jgi:hypothetical protein